MEQSVCHLSISEGQGQCCVIPPLGFRAHNGIRFKKPVDVDPIPNSIMYTYVRAAICSATLAPSLVYSYDRFRWSEVAHTLNLGTRC